MDQAFDALRSRADTLPTEDGPGVLSGRNDLSIGDMARAFSITPRALRFYEAKGLLRPRRDGAMRLYGRAERERLGLVLRAKRLGFTLGEIRQILAAPDGPAEAGELNISRRQCFDQIKLLEARKREIEAALAELRRTYSSFYARMVEGAVRNRV
jgi:DNA-binding transcriptional MerR regulator